MTVSTESSAEAPPHENAPRSMIVNFASIFVGRLLSALSIWLALVFLTKMTDPATVGVYALAQAICIPIAEVAKMSLREARSSDTVGFFLFGDYLGLRLLATSIAFLLMLAGGLVQSDSMAMLLVMILYALTRCAELVSDMVYGLFQAHERMDYIGRSLCLVGPLSLLLLIAGYWFTGSLVVAVLGQLAAYLAILALHDLPVGRRRARLGSETFRPRWNPSSLRRLASQTAPLTFASLLVIIALYLPRVTVEHELGLTGLGLFAAILALAMAPDRLVNAMGVAVSMRLARHFAAGRRGDFIRLLSGMAMGVAFFGALGVAICALEGEAILRLVYTEAYAEHSELLVWLVAAASLRCVANILRYGLVAARRFWWLGAQNGAAALVAVTGCLTLIPRFGLSGAGATMFFVFAAQLIVVFSGVLTSLKAARISERGA